MNELDSLVASAQALFAQSTTPADLENAKAQFLGKSGRITEMMKGMAALSVEEKKSIGAAINVAKQAIEAALTARRQALADAELETQLKAEALDVTLPGRARMAGGLHPVTITLERVEAIFGSMGFEVAQGPEIETDWFNFTALNTPEDHPARSMHDTFYVEGGSASAFLTELKKVKAQGYALDRGEESETFACVSAPIFDHRGHPVAAIWISGPSDRVTPSALDKLGLKVKQFADQLSQRLGYQTKANPFSNS